MDQLNRWFLEVSDSPVGSIVLFLGVFLVRVAMDRHWHKRAKRKAKPHARKPA